ncbi:BTB/POZ domain-containing protein At1g21780-like [Zingiber officinale]|uniref:BTB domain-containing protein n=1 Tax=Zingiber officinale TaxID=94328 RepID=A0A8J5FPC8_ZINOF|nr:BTB/POZ domain-containing protein At1g21780-like [Zingiber officinale]KAG6491429.1 hypothetical protein ZIOFF_052772 [Zingiber officinale]
MADGENNGSNKVKLLSRLAQWTVENLSFNDSRRSDAFKIGIWKWCLIVDNEDTKFSIRLVPDPNCITEDKQPIAKIMIHLDCTGSIDSHYVSPVYEKLFKTEKECIWHVEPVSRSSVRIEVKFLNLKISNSNDITSPLIWSDDSLPWDYTSKITLCSISRMFQESIHTDVTIETLDGSLKAHKAVLASSSPVFKQIFLDDLEEKQSSTIKIEDMSTDACSALLEYMYGTIKQDNFLKHRLPLLAAADKYNLQDLRKCCEEMLMEDIDSSNVFERLQEAWKYKLNDLVEDCFIYLFDFGKVHDLREELDDFFLHADRELLLEFFKESAAAT